MTSRRPQASAIWLPWKELAPWEDNPRDNEEAVEGVALSIEVYGWGAPVVATVEGQVLAGHTRLKACQFLELKTWDGDDNGNGDWVDRTEPWQLEDAPAPGMVPVRRLTMSQAQAIGYAIADNRTGERAQWQAETLDRHHRWLRAHDPRAARATGFTEGEVRARLKPQRRPLKLRDDRPPTDPVSKPGETYQLGPHRLHCGSSADPASWEAILGDGQADHIFTDPPYGIDVVAGAREATPEERKRAGERTIANDNLKDEDLLQLLHDVFHQVKARVKPGGSLYACWTSASNMALLLNVIGSYPYVMKGEIHEGLDMFRWQLVWKKHRMVLARSDYHFKHEQILYGWMPGAGHAWTGARTSTSVIEVDAPQRADGHPTAKPPKLIVETVGNNTAAGDVIVDPFGGSGSTMVAADYIGCSAVLIEVDPRYCDLIRRTWHALAAETGRDPGPDALDPGDPL